MVGGQVTFLISFAVAGFELGWAEISQAAEQAAAVLSGDVLGDGAAAASWQYGCQHETLGPTVVKRSALVG